MPESSVTVVIPNYNGIAYIRDCLDSLLSGTVVPEILVVDNASADGSREVVEKEYAGRVTLLSLRSNTGFCHAVNSGIHLARTPYVMLLNNDTLVTEHCVERLLAAISRKERIFSVQAKLLSYADHHVIDDAGDEYCALGWAFARGSGKPAEAYDRPSAVFSCCAAAAIYRMSTFEEIGYFDERHYCYLEDVDIGWRARIYGYQNWYEPAAVVYHVGSAASGSRHNPFKEICTSGNNRYLLWKNMPAFQRGLNWPLTALGAAVKRRYFTQKGLGESYDSGYARGAYLIELAKYEDLMRRYDSPEKRPLMEEAGLMLDEEEEESDAATGAAGAVPECPADLTPDSGTTEKPLIHPLYLGGTVPFRVRHLFNYFRIQFALWGNLGRRLKQQ